MKKLLLATLAIAFVTSLAACSGMSTTSPVVGDICGPQNKNELRCQGG